MKNLLVILFVGVALGCSNEKSIEGYWVEEDVNGAIFLFEDLEYSSYFYRIGHLEPSKYHIAADSLILESDANWKIIWVDDESINLEKEDVVSKLKKIDKWKAELFIDMLEKTWEESVLEEEIIEIKEQ